MRCLARTNILTNTSIASARAGYRVDECEILCKAIMIAHIVSPSLPDIISRCRRYYGSYTSRKVCIQSVERYIKKRRKVESARDAI